MKSKTKHYVYVWEMGSGYAHLSLGIPIMEALARHGQRVSLVVNDPARARSMLGGHCDDIYACPRWPQPQSTRAPRSYAQVLKNQGYDNPKTLTGMVLQWRQLYEAIQPDCLIFDHAPTALLAARCFDVRQALVGHGFLIPPRQSPLPPFWLDQETALGNWIDDEAQVLASCNEALTHSHRVPMNNLCDLFDVDETFLTTWPELDCYGKRSGAKYWGPQQALAHGDQPAWPQPAASGRRIFAYLRSTLPVVKNFIEVCKQTPHALIVHVDPAIVDDFAAPAGERIRLVSQLLNMRQVTAEADVLVCHGGIGTIGAALYAGKPSISIPLQMEQFLIAKRVEAVKAGLIVREASIRDALLPALEEAAFKPDLSRGAQQFVGKYAGLSTVQADEIAECLLGQ